MLLARLRVRVGLQRLRGGLRGRLLVASAPFASASVRSKVGTFGASGTAVAVAAVEAGADAVVPAAGIAIAPEPPVSLASASCSASRLVAGVAWVVWAAASLAA